MTATMPGPTIVSPEPTADAVRKRSWYSALLLGKQDDPCWVRPSLIALLVLTGILYLWGLGESDLGLPRRLIFGTARTVSAGSPFPSQVDRLLGTIRALIRVCLGGIEPATDG